jgi:hypothetical protein
MLKTNLTRFILPVLLAAGCGAANAGVLTFQGVTFTATTTGNTLKLEIDAAHRTGDWAGATTIGALELQSIGQFSGVHLVQAPGAASGWAATGQGLTAKGCGGGKQADKFACFSGAHVALQDDMVFQFAFDGNGVDLGAPNVKVNFFAGDGTKKVGSLLSQTVPADVVVTPPPPPPPTPVSEPVTAAMLASGLALMGMVKRKRGAKRVKSPA